MHLQRLLATAWLAVLAGCGTPDGSNVARDIELDFYGNEPLAGVALQPDPTKPNDWVVPFSAMRKARGDNPDRIGASIASSDVPWQVPAACRAEFRAWVINQDQRGPVVEEATYDRFFATHPKTCPRSKSLVGVAISGGGPKSAIFATEVLFELQRYGLAEEIDVISSVSGGSYAAALHAYSCDDDNCPKVASGTRQRWDYAAISDKVGTNNFIRDFGVIAALRSPLAWVGTGSNTSDTYARVLARTYGIPLDATFAELNPARPNLILNATNDTRSRINFDSGADIPHSDRRPLSFDDALHFSFTEQYFWRLLSNLSSYKINFAVAASGAFPLVVDHVGLRQYHAKEVLALAAGDTVERGSARYVSLQDGGVNDNFGVMELGWIVECQFGLTTPNGGFLGRGQLAVMDRTNPTSPAAVYRRRCGRDLPPVDAQAPKSVLILGINASENRSDGPTDEQPKPVDALDRVLPYLKPASTLHAVGQIMNTAGERRRQSMGDVLNTILRQKDFPQKKEKYLSSAAGPMRYMDIDIDAVQVLYCEPKSMNDPTILNPATASSDEERCASLKGVLEWQRDRNLDLPTIDPTFCADNAPCADLARFVGTDVAARMEKLRADGDNEWLTVPMGPTGIDLPVGKRPFNNRFLFDSIRDVSLLVNNPAEVTALRYLARWAVAHRLSDLCRPENPTVLEEMGKFAKVCLDRLPARPVGPEGDGVGGKRFNAMVLRR